MKGMFGIAMAILGFSLLPPESAGYCWQAGWNPSFAGPPTVRQISVDRVRVSWEGAIKNRECADQLLVKFWPKRQPDRYEMTDMVENTADSIDVGVTPRLMYTFQAVAREDKGTIGGIDWNKSPVAEFQTAHNPSPNVTVAAQREPNATFSTTVMVIAVSAVCGVLLIGGLILFVKVKLYSP